MDKKKLPSYEELFENLDYYSADESRSVLSPAAYLTDIMNLKDWDYTNDDAVDDRRNDISDIILDAENTFTEIPHLDVANDVMERKINSLESSNDPYDEVLIDAKFPLNAPFNLHKTEINNMLSYFKSDPASFYKAFTASPDPKIVAREMLGLSEEEINILITSEADEIKLKAYYGLKDTETLQSLATATVEESLLKFRTKADLSAMQLNELLFQNLSEVEKSNHQSRRFFINHTGADNQPYLNTRTVELVDADSAITKKYERQELILTIEDTTEIVEESTEIEKDISPDYFDRLHRFLRLSMKTGLSFADLDQIIMDLCDKTIDAETIQIIAIVKLIAEKYELKIEEVCALFGPIKDYGMGEKTSKIDMFNSLFNEEGGLTDISDVDPTDDDELFTFQNRVQASLECKEDEYHEINDFIGGSWTTGEIKERLAVMYRIKKLATLFDISVTALLKFFTVIDKNMGLIEAFKFQVPLELDKLSKTCHKIITDYKGLVTIKEKLRLIQMTVVMMEWLIENEISVEQLEFICTEHSSTEVDGVMSDEDRNDLFRDLENQFRGVLFSANSMQSGITNKEIADKLFETFSKATSNIVSPHGLIKKSISESESIDEISPAYTSAIHDILFIECDDIITKDTTEPIDSEIVILETIFNKMKNKEYIDLENFITNTVSNIEFFSNQESLSQFIPELQTEKESEKIVKLVFQAMSDRAASYKKAKENSKSECAVIAEKISTCAQRQKTVLLRALESGMGISFKTVEILLNTLFRTTDETEEMSIVRFMAPLFDGITHEELTGTLKFNASLVTSFRRMLQFALLVSKCDLNGKELDVLFDIKKVQNSLPEKIKLPTEFKDKIDSMYIDSSDDIVIFSGEKYIKYSGSDYSVINQGNISDIVGIPESFHPKINSALRDQKIDDTERKTYFFAGDKYIDESNPSQEQDTKDVWGKVKNNIVEQNIVDAAYKADDGKVFIFSGDQYVRYSDASRDFVDEGYPKNTLEHWNSEDQVKLPPDVRSKVDTVFNIGTELYIFSGDKFINSSNPSDVLNTGDTFGFVLNNIIENNKVDASIVADGKTYLLSGDQYTKYSTNDYSFVDEGYPKKIADHWSSEGIINIPEEFNNLIDTSFTGTDGNLYIFKEDLFASSEDSSILSQVKDKWGKVENNIETLNKIDAAFTSNEKTYLFTGDQYTRYSSGYSFADEGYPKKIATNWNVIEECGILPESFNSEINSAFTAEDNNSYIFSGNSYVNSNNNIIHQVKDSWGKVENNIQTDNAIDAAFKAPDGKTYIFGGDQFYRYSGTDYSNADECYPKKIADHWGNLPDSFRQKIDAAFVLNVGDEDRLYLFSDYYYVRYTGNDYSQIDSGYPKKLNEGYNPEGSWFNKIFYCEPDNYEYCAIDTIFIDQYNNRDRINYIYRDSNNVQKLRTYQYNGFYWDWSGSTKVTDLSIDPFTSIDAGFIGADDNIYLFSGTDYAVLEENYTSISTPADTKGKWGKVLNRFEELNRVDSSYHKTDGKTYLFCEDQYIRYSGEITPDAADFFVDEGYPKKIDENWNSENSGINLPQIFTPGGMAIFEGSDNKTYFFYDSSFINDDNQTAVPINSIWGKIINNFESINKVDAAGIYNSKTYLFCEDQYTRYSEGYSGYADEGYPKKISNMPESDQIPGIMNFQEGITSLLEGTDSNHYIFKDGSLVSSEIPSEIKNINSKFGIVKNNITINGIIDAANAQPDGKIYLFSGDQYVRYSNGIQKYIDESYPKNIACWENTEGEYLPTSALEGIKAMFDDADGETYIFTNSEYITLSNPSTIAPINSKWGKVKNNIAETGIIDATFIAVDGKTYLFSGDQYTCYSNGKSDYVDEGFPKVIADNWGEDLPQEYKDGIDAGLVFDGRTYFFKDDEYVRYSDSTCKKIDTGFPIKISEKMSILPEIKLDDIKTFQQFKKLCKTFSSPDANILNFFKSEDDDLSSLLSKITGWNSEEINYLLSSTALTVDTDDNLPELRDIQTLSEMKSIFDISDKLGASPSTIVNELWSKIFSETKDLKKSATTMKGLLKSVTGSGSWKDLDAELHGKMNVAKRDALMGYLIHKMEQQSETSWIDNPRDLYEYLLLDVEMGEEATTSRVQEAIMCMQLFYHRMLINLEMLLDANGEEDKDATSTIKTKLLLWWKWMKNYRIWEANRKVFLYPENYIRPELRLDKSPEFKELEEALLQSDITSEATEKAYKAYLDKYSEISKLKIAGGYVYQRVLGDSNDTSSTADAINEKQIFMFGHSATEPKKYYYMSGDILDSGTGQTEQTIDWMPWKELGITIDAEKVYPVFSFNKLFVFWVEIRERDKSTYVSSVGPDSKVTQYDPVIYYTFHNHNGDWAAPQKMFDVGAYVDVKAPNSINLFTENNTQKGTATYIPARDVLKNNATLYVTNPITSSSYTADEFVYISFEIIYKSYPSFKVEGKFKSNFEFIQEEVKTEILDKLEKNIQFPVDKFGITPSFSNHWKGFFNDAFSAPWFNFSDEGGNFLLKPAVVIDAPVIKKDKKLFEDILIKLPGEFPNAEWPNLPDSGFTDQYNRQHLFYRKDLAADAEQYYVMVDEVENDITTPVPVTDKWGKKNIFEWYPHEVECAAVDAAEGNHVYIVSNNGRYVSYTGTQTDIIDQTTIEETAVTDIVLTNLKSKVLPSGILTEPWNLVKANLKDYIATIQDAFVCGSEFYLVASPNGSTNEFTMPNMTDFWKEMAALNTDVSATISNWTSVRSAMFYEDLGAKRLYLTSGDQVFIKDYLINKNFIRTVAECTHPDLITPVYDSTPIDATETIWPENTDNLPGFIEELLPRLTGVGKENGEICFIAQKEEPSDTEPSEEKTYEYTVPESTKLFDFFEYIIGKTEHVGNPAGITGDLTTLDAANLVGSKLYLRSEDTVFTYDLDTAIWALDYFHPDVTTKISTTEGRLPETEISWPDVAEDFTDYCKTVTKALVWKGIFYLITPKTGGGYEFTSPDGNAFWSAVSEICPDASGLTSIDSACVLHEVDGLKLYVTSLNKVAVCDLSKGEWTCQTTDQRWGLTYDKINSIMEVKDGNDFNVYIFSGRQYAEKKNGEFVSAAISERWGAQPNGGGVVDSAFMDKENRVYLFSGTTFVRYKDVDNKVIDPEYPKDILTDLNIDIDEVKRQFSTDIQSVDIKPIKTNTAFTQMVNGEEKFYLFLDIDATITTYIWKPRWKWQGFWTIRRYRGWWGWYHRWFRSYWGRWVLTYDKVEDKKNERKSQYIRFSTKSQDNIIDYEMDNNYPKNINGNWSGLPGDFNKMITSTFEDKEGSGENERKIFYIARSLEENGVTVNDYIKYTGEENFPREISEEQYEIIRLTSNTSESFSQKLFSNGIDGLLTLSTQCVDELPAFEQNNGNVPQFVYDDNLGNNQVIDDISMEYIRKDNTIFYNNTFLNVDKVPESKTLDFGSINGQYYWEIFFHAPFLIAQTFNNAQKFEEGKKWYEYVFNPTNLNEGFTDNGLPNQEAKPYWGFVPFHKDLANNQLADLNDSRQYNRYLNDPFDPHAIAGLRQIAYRKSIVMNYIDNLIDHGDMLFRQYTRESINEARMFYVLAYDLLGKQPELLGTQKLSDSQSYKDLHSRQDDLIALLDLENLPENSDIPLSGSGDTVHGSVLDATGYFYIPENREFAVYWDTVIDRLTKIRATLNIDGVKQSLALYEPPIDPMALVRAVGSGAGLAAALADFKVDVPHYRFNFIMGKARELTSRLTQFGQNLLSALEKKDAEDLSILRNTHEKAIMQLTLDIKNAQLKDSEETLDSLRVNLKSAKIRETHYNLLISSGLSPFEQSQIGLLISSQVFSTISQVFSTASSIGSYVPQLGSPFAMQFGGINIGQGLLGAAGAMSGISSGLSMGANMSSILGGYHRRGQDWTLQKNTASCDIESINRQIAGAEIKVKIARLEIETAKKNMKNLESVDTFMKDKFTNAHLYRWMAGRLSGLYFQTYQMALDMAKGAQKSFQFELGLKEKDISFITSLYWDSLKKGLLAGETLQVDLDRMETAYIERNKRKFEISKSISLTELNPLALINLREKRSCDFTLGEDLFDSDFPGHYCRQIKSVSLTFPAIVGPNGNLNATLTQLSHRTLLEPDKEGVKYMLNPEPEVSQPLSIRGDWRVNQQVALSRGVNDSGLFQLNFQDERYLPFEGTGAVSTWKLDLNGLKSNFDVNTLSDVIIKIEYTSTQGGDSFGATVKKELKKQFKEQPEAKMFCLAQDFSAEWNAFMADPFNGLSVTMEREMFTDMSNSKVTCFYMLYKLSEKGEGLGDIPMKLNTLTLENGALSDGSLSISASGSTWKLTPDSSSENFTPENIEDIMLICMYDKKGEF